MQQRSPAGLDNVVVHGLCFKPLGHKSTPTFGILQDQLNLDSTWRVNEVLLFVKNQLAKEILQALFFLFKPALT